MQLFRFSFVFLVLALIGCGAHKPEIKVLPKADAIEKRTLFIAFDGISYDMMHSLKKRGYFKDFENFAPLVVTFPSATTIGFTGLFKPLNVGQVQGYEVRFFSYDEGRVIGGTPKDIYKIPINYKTYFDSYRHSVQSKFVMYAFPGVAGKQDLIQTRRLLYDSNKNVIISYLGGTDGAQHLLGRHRVERFMIYADKYIRKMKSEYLKKTGNDLRVVLFSDHGFHFDEMKMIWGSDINKHLKRSGYRLSDTIEDFRDVVLTKFGVLSSGVAITQKGQESKVSQIMANVEGMDLVFWFENNKVHILNSKGEEAYFEYKSPNLYAYRVKQGDPLGYLPLLKSAKLNGFINEAKWLKLTANSYYPDAGYRLYDAFNGLVKNKASILFSLKEPYQFGGLAAFLGTQTKIGGHKGTHGALFRDASLGIVMSNDKEKILPEVVRYDQLFPIFLKPVTDAYRLNGNKSVQPIVH